MKGKKKAFPSLEVSRASKNSLQPRPRQGWLGRRQQSGGSVTLPCPRLLPWAENRMGTPWAAWGLGPCPEFQCLAPCQPRWCRPNGFPLFAQELPVLCWGPAIILFVPAAGVGGCWGLPPRSSCPRCPLAWQPPAAMAEGGRRPREEQRGRGWKFGLGPTGSAHGEP